MKSRTRSGLLAMLGVFALGCDDAVLEPDPDLAFLVGTWEAARLVLMNEADTTVAPDLVELGARFTLIVEPSGSYQANLIFRGGSPAVVFGRVERDGDELVFDEQQSTGVPVTSRARFQERGDTLRLEGPTRFDFNFDGLPESARMRADLLRQ